MLGIPTATVELATRSGSKGIVTRSFVKRGAHLAHGNELLSAIYPAYPQAQRTNNTAGYTVEAIRNALEPYSGPEGDEIPGLASAFDWFCGYLFFDAWINNTDRHHMNWGVLDPAKALAPSFDHGSSLAFGEPDTRKVTWRPCRRVPASSPSAGGLLQRGGQDPAPHPAPAGEASQLRDTGELVRIVAALGAAWWVAITRLQQKPSAQPHRPLGSVTLIPSSATLRDMSSEAIRIGSTTLSSLRERSRQSGEPIVRLAQRYIDEGMQLDRHPGIVFRDGPAGRRAVVVGGPDVWEVIAAARSAPESGQELVETLATRIGVPAGRIQMAVRYYAEYPEEVDRFIAQVEEDAGRLEAAAERERSLLE